MTEEQCWALIEELGWGTRTTDYKALKRKIFNALGVNNCGAFRDFIEERIREVFGRLDTYDKKCSEDDTGGFELGDSSFSDLCSHIVGLGKEEFDATMRDPELARQRALKGDFKANFWWSIPSRSTREFDLKQYKSFAKSILFLTEARSYYEIFDHGKGKFTVIDLSHIKETLFQGSFTSIDEAREFVKKHNDEVEAIGVDYNKLSSKYIKNTKQKIGRIREIISLLVEGKIVEFELCIDELLELGEWVCSGANGEIPAEFRGQESSIHNLALEYRDNILS